MTSVLAVPSVPATFRGAAAAAINKAAASAATAVQCCRRRGRWPPGSLRLVVEQERPFQAQDASARPGLAGRRAPERCAAAGVVGDAVANEHPNAQAAGENIRAARCRA